MATTDTEKLYEILIRFDRDGNLVAAHAQWARTVIVDGETLKDWEPGARNGENEWVPSMLVPIDLVGGADASTLQTVLGEATEQAIATAASQASQIAALQAANDDNAATISDLNSQIATLQAELLAAQSAQANVED